MRTGWWSLFLFAALGMALELMHGFKFDFYLSVYNETRRHLWTLAHLHGTLLALIHLAFAATLHAGFGARDSSLRLASRALSGSSLLLPGGFFVGGAVIYGGDPNLGVLLVPVGAALLLLALLLMGRELLNSVDERD
jgi:hypothetical protein